MLLLIYGHTLHYPVKKKNNNNNNNKKQNNKKKNRLTDQT